MSAVARLEKSRNRMLTDLPYVAPPGATPEGKQAVYDLRTTPMQPSEGCDSCIQHLVKGNPKRFDRSKTRSRLHNKEYLIALILETLGHSSSVMPEWWIPRSTARLPAKRAADSPEPVEVQDAPPELYDLSDLAR